MYCAEMKGEQGFGERGGRGDEGFWDEGVWGEDGMGRGKKKGGGDGKDGFLGGSF